MKLGVFFLPGVSPVVARIAKKYLAIVAFEIQSGIELLLQFHLGGVFGYFGFLANFSVDAEFPKIDYQQVFPAKKQEFKTFFRLRARYL